MSSSLGGYRGPTGQFGSNTMGPRGGGPGDVIPKGYRKGQIAQFDPQQMDLYQQAFSQAAPDSYLSKLAGGNQSLFEQMEAPAHRQFQGQLGQLASKFSGMGTGGRKNSGFQNMATAGASNFAEQLQSNRQNLQRQAMMDLRGLTGELLNYRPYEKFLMEKQKKQGGLGGWGGIGGAALGGAAGLFFGNPMGGAMLGYGMGSAFDNPGGGGGGGMNSGGSGGFGSFRNPFGGGGGDASGYDRQFRQEGLTGY